MEAATTGYDTVVEPPGGLAFPSLRELWAYRDLVYFLVRRDLAVRYKQSVAGTLWALLQPVLLATVFSVFLGLLAKVPSEHGIPYPVFAVSGLTLWIFFANAVSRCSTSTIESTALISKVYFPRIVIPVAAVIPPAVDFMVAFAVVIGAMLIYGVTPASTILLVPLLVPLITALALGFGLWLAALNVRYRDVSILVPFSIQLGLFVTPIIYPFSVVPANLHWLYGLNPLVGVLELYRWLIFNGTDWPGLLLAVPALATVGLLVSGALYFNRAERTFADVI